MGYIIPAGFTRVTYEYGARSALGSQIVFGFGVNTPPSEALLDVLEEWWTESLQLVTSNDYTLNRIEARSDVEVIDRNVGSSGTISGEMLPPNTAVLVALGSGLVGRTNRGRMYLPGVAQEAEVSVTGAISTTLQASLQGVVDFLGALLFAEDWRVVILHSDVGAPTLVTTAQVQSVVATQRRRLRA